MKARIFRHLKIKQWRLAIKQLRLAKRSCENESNEIMPIFCSMVWALSAVLAAIMAKLACGVWLC